MDWKRAAIEDLKLYHRRRDSLNNLKDRIQALKEHYLSVKCSLGSDAAPVKNGSSKIEDRMLNNIVERERLTHTYKATRRLVELTERGLKGLDDKERLVIERFFVTKERNHVERLMDELHVEKSHVYRLKDRALYNFTVTMYGLIDY